MSRRSPRPWVLRVKNADSEPIRLNVRSNAILGDADLRTIASDGVSVVGYERVDPNTLSGWVYAWVFGPQHRSFSVRIDPGATSGVWGASYSPISLTVGDPKRLCYACVFQLSLDDQVLRTSGGGTVEMEYDSSHTSSALRCTRSTIPCDIQRATTGHEDEDKKLLPQEVLKTIVSDVGHFVSQYFRSDERRDGDGNPGSEPQN